MINMSGALGTSLVAQMRETWVQSLGQEDPLEKEMATHSSTLAWKIPWMEEPGRLQSMGSVTKSRTRLSDFTFTFQGHNINWLESNGSKMADKSIQFT